MRVIATVKAGQAAPLVCDVEFQEWTRNGTLRHPAYKGLLPATKAKDVVVVDKVGDDEL